MIATLGKLGGIGALILSTILIAGTASGELLTKKTLSLEDAKKVAAGAAAEARKNKWNMDIAVVDDGGHLIYFERTDGTLLASADLAIGKGRTAVEYQRPTKALEDALNGGHVRDPVIPERCNPGGRSAARCGREDCGRNRCKRWQAFRRCPGCQGRS